MPGKQKLDQYFTAPEVAKACWERFLDVVKPEMNGKFIEPSAGQGAFCEVMKDVDVISYELDEELAYENGHVQADFLALTKFHGVHDNNPVYVVGNPPFGYQGKLAKAFIRKSFELGAKYVGLIVPPSGMKIKQYGFHEIDRWSLPYEYCFIDAQGEPLQVYNCWFAIYAFGSNNDGLFESKPICDNYISLHSISRNEKKPRMKFHDVCDVFLPHSLWTSQSSKMKVYETMDMNDMVGVRILKEREAVLKVLNETDWFSKMTKTPHGACHLTMQIIKDEFIKVGLCD